MALRVAVQMDPLESVNIDADSTFALMLEAGRRGHSMLVYHPDALSYRDGAVSAQMQPVTVQLPLGSCITRTIVRCLHGSRRKNPGSAWLPGQFSKGGVIRMTPNPTQCQARVPKKPDPESRAAARRPRTRTILLLMAPKSPGVTVPSPRTE